MMMEIIDAYALVFRDIEGMWEQVLNDRSHAADDDEDAEIVKYANDLYQTLLMLMHASGIQSFDGLRNWEVK